MTFISENKKNLSNAFQKKIGFFEEYYFNGQLAQKGNYKDGKRDGLWKWYYENENVLALYKNGKFIKNIE